MFTLNCFMQWNLVIRLVRKYFTKKNNHISIQLQSIQTNHNLRIKFSGPSNQDTFFCYGLALQLVQRNKDGME